MPTQTETRVRTKEQPVEEPQPASTDLADDIRRLRTEERAKIERARQEELARLRELARFD